MIREIQCPPNTPGKLFRSPMPGSREFSLKDAFDGLDEHKIDLIVRLAPFDEIKRYAPRYARLLDEEALACEVWELEIPDMGMPDDEEEFFDFARDIAYELKDGTNILIHCYAGIGRTGTMATCVLMALGLSLEAAKTAVDAAGAGPETYNQQNLVKRAAAMFAQDI